jgi:hypothetical protein
VIVPRLEWLLPEPFPEPPSLAGFGRPVATLLARRGFRDDAQLSAFLLAGEGSLHDVSLMADADVALDRIERAIEAGERIAIWGDYDADGMTAVVVWVLALAPSASSRCGMCRRGWPRATGFRSAASSAWRRPASSSSSPATAA